VHRNQVIRQAIAAPVKSTPDPMPLEVDEFEIILAPKDWYTDVAEFEMEGIDRALGIAPKAKDHPLATCTITAGAESSNLFFGAAIKYVERVTPAPEKDPAAQSMIREQMLALVE
jgi:hypothetical protein